MKIISQLIITKNDGMTDTLLANIFTQHALNVRQEGTLRHFARAVEMRRKTKWEGPTISD